MSRTWTPRRGSCLRNSTPHQSYVSRCHHLNRRGKNFLLSCRLVFLLVPSAQGFVPIVHSFGHRLDGEGIAAFLRALPALRYDLTSTCGPFYLGSAESCNEEEMWLQGCQFTLNGYWSDPTTLEKIVRVIQRFDVKAEKTRYAPFLLLFPVVMRTHAVTDPATETGC